MKEHRDLISDLQNSSDKTMFITASKDNAAKVIAMMCGWYLCVCCAYFVYLLFQLFDSDKLDLLKTYRTERPVNSAAISPINDRVSSFLIVSMILGITLDNYCPSSGGVRRRARSHGSDYDHHQSRKV